MAERLTLTEHVGRIVQLCGERGASEFEFGYSPLGGPGAPEPRAGEPCTWWATCTYHGRKVYRQHVGTGQEPLLKAVTDVARAIGLRVRLRIDDGSGELVEYA